jgi:tetratricopeptide (TPR) repeat protein
MANSRIRSTLLLSLAFATACASAEDRLNEGISLQSQGRYIQAVYRYAEAVEKDGDLAPARNRMRAAGDSAVTLAMDDADQLERRGDPVQAASRYVEIDRMLARVREVGERIDLPSDYGTIRRGIFDAAIDWQMSEGDRAAEEGRWPDARGFYAGARANYLPSRDQVEESYEAETQLLLRWAEIDLEDQHYLSAYEMAEEALAVRSSPARATVLAVRDIQERALEAGTVVLAVVPVTADPGVREWLGGEFEVKLDSDLGMDYWNRPPPFIQMADPLLLRSELRGLLRGQAVQSPMLVGRALDLIGADLGVMVRIASIDVVEEDVRQDTRTAVVERNRRPRGGMVSGMSYAMSDGVEPQFASARGDNNGRGPRDDDERGNDPCGKSNNGRGPPEAGNNGRGPDRDRADCPVNDSTGTGGGDMGPGDTGGADSGGGDTGSGNTGGRDTGSTGGSDAGNGRPGPGEDRRSGPEGRGIDTDVGGTTTSNPGTHGRPGSSPVATADTVQYRTYRGTMTYYVEAEILLVDPMGREVNRFTASSRQSGPFERGEFDGDPRILRLQRDEARFFDPAVLGGQMAAIEASVLEELSAAVATGTYDQVLGGIR